MKWIPLVLACFVSTPVSAGVFEKLKSLEGRWRMTEGGTETEVRYELRAGGSVVVEHLWDMVTTYHKDGDRLVATHYCSMANQPRMVAAPADQSEDEVSFRFLDITGNTAHGHISGVAFKFLSPTHFVQTWTSRNASGEDEAPFQLSYHRLPEAGQIGIVRTKEMRIAVATMRVVDLSQVGPILGSGLPRVASYIEKVGGKIVGPAMLRAIKFSDDEKIFEYGFSVESEIASGEGIANETIPGGLAVKAEHFGAHDQLTSTHERIDQFVVSNSLAVIGPVWEIYVSDPDTTPIHKTLTEVYYPVALNLYGGLK